MKFRLSDYPHLVLEKTRVEKAPDCSSVEEIVVLWLCRVETSRQLEKMITQGKMLGFCDRGRFHTTWMDKVKAWTGLSMEDRVRVRDNWTLV